MHVKTLAMMSTLLIAGLLYGCSEPQKPRMIDFRQKAYPAEVASVSGISKQEEWGRWTDADRAVIQFKKTLPSAFQLKLQTAWAFGPNQGLPFQVSAGGVQKEFKVSTQNQLIVLDFEKVGKTDRLELIIPKPTTPKDLAMSDDMRKLGLGVVTLAIEPRG